MRESRSRLGYGGPLAADRIQNAFRRHFGNKGFSHTDALWQAYLRWGRKYFKENFERFYQAYIAELEGVKSRIEAWPSPFINAKKGEHYQINFNLPPDIIRHQFFGLEKIGLGETLDPENQHLCIISGIPKIAGSFKIDMFYVCKGWISDGKLMKKEFQLLVNPDPKDLWEDIPSDQSQEYARHDLEFAQLTCPPASLWGASRRGRSHAHAGKPRDDAFLLGCHNNWKIMAVADGAGSAEFSRKGAEMACSTSVAACKEKLPPGNELEQIFLEVYPERDPATWKNKAHKLAYNILPAAAFAAHKAIRQEAENRGREMRSYASTLLLALAKQFQSGWAVLSFQIGDGAMGLFADGKAELLARPDEGEYGGQTRFITMNEIFDSSQDLLRRQRIEFVSDLQGLLLMTDGVSDANFQTPQGLDDSSEWFRLWRELLGLAHAYQPEEDLLDWLNFWSRGNHDDRTIAIMSVEKQLCRDLVKL